MLGRGEEERRSVVERGGAGEGREECGGERRNGWRRREGVCWREAEWVEEERRVELERGGAGEGEKRGVLMRGRAGGAEEKGCVGEKWSGRVGEKGCVGEGKSGWRRREGVC